MFELARAKGQSTCTEPTVIPSESKAKFLNHFLVVHRPLRFIYIKIVSLLLTKYTLDQVCRTCMSTSRIQLRWLGSLICDGTCTPRIESRVSMDDIIHN
jgi:hypothetical protein